MKSSRSCYTHLTNSQLIGKTTPIGCGGNKDRDSNDNRSASFIPCRTFSSAHSDV